MHPHSRQKIVLHIEVDLWRKLGVLHVSSVSVFQKTYVEPVKRARVVNAFKLRWKKAIFHKKNRKAAKSNKKPKSIFDVVLGWTGSFRSFDQTVLGVVCFAQLWNFGRMPPLLELQNWVTKRFEVGHVFLTLFLQDGFAWQDRALMHANHWATANPLLHFAKNHSMNQD